MVHETIVTLITTFCGKRWAVNGPRCKGCIARVNGACGFIGASPEEVQNLAAKIETEGK